MIKLPAVADDECHHPGVAVLDRPGHQSKAGDHVPVDDVVIFSARCGGPLPCQNVKKVAVSGLGSGTILLARRVPFHGSLGD